MRDEHSTDLKGWARFSVDNRMRYRLARSFTPFSPEVERLNGSPRAVWIMLNPSTADAFKVDPTVNECAKRSRAYGCDSFEVVNLFALRSPYPADLEKCAFGFRGDDAVNDAEILDACRGAKIVIAAWGNHGKLDSRDRYVRRLLAEAGVRTYHLGLTQGSFPKHPLARGKHRIPADQELAVFE